MSGAILERNRDTRVLAFGEGTILVMTEVAVRETLEQACAPQGCSGAGIGVGAYGGASVEMMRFLVEESALCGLQIARGMYEDDDGMPTDFLEAGTIDLHTGIVRDNPIGANVQADDFDIERLRDDVRWDNDDVDIDTSEIYVPTASDVFEDAP